MWKMIMALGLVLVMSACGQTNQSESQDKTDSNSNGAAESVEIAGDINAEIDPFDFKNALSKSNLIAEVTITEKVEEVDAEHIPYTVFKAEVNNSFKGKAKNEEITIKQQGTSEFKFNSNELFKQGEKYIFFLKETKESKADYWIIGEGTGMFKVLDDKKVVKLIEPIGQLKDVELPDQSKANENKGNGHGPEQVLDKKQFIEKIKTQKGGA